MAKKSPKKTLAKPSDTQIDLPDDLPENLAADLSRAGEVIEKAIEHLMDKDVDEMAIASALLGGALSMLADCTTDEGIVTILENAIASVKDGELHREEPASPA